MMNLVAYSWMAVWILISIAIILVNKYVIFYSGFHFPVALAFWHMVVATTTSRLLLTVLALPDTIRENQTANVQVQLAAAGILFGASLVAGNAALLYLSVPTIQMLKALCPVAVYLAGTLMLTETPTWLRSFQVLIVSAGVTIAGLGDITFNMLGITLQVAAIAMDAVRSCTLQCVMQAHHMQASPLVTLAHVAPYAAASLALPVALVEGHALVVEYQDWAKSIPAVILSGGLAAVLNLVIFKLIQLTSALTMSLTGVFKDWVCIVLSMYLFHTVVSPTQWIGFTLAIAGLMWYHQGKMQELRPQLTANREDVECTLVKTKLVDSHNRNCAVSPDDN